MLTKLEKHRLQVGDVLVTEKGNYLINQMQGHTVMSNYIDLVSQCGEGRVFFDEKESKNGKSIYDGEYQVTKVLHNGELFECNKFYIED